MELNKNKISFSSYSDLYHIRTEQLLDTPIDEAWAYFSNPANLKELTPEEMEFNILSNPAPEMYEGQIIVYKIKLLPFININWVTEIKNVDALRSFVDEQKFGPYQLSITDILLKQQAKAPK